MAAHIQIVSAPADALYEFGPGELMEILKHMFNTRTLIALVCMLGALLVLKGGGAFMGVDRAQAFAAPLWKIPSRSWASAHTLQRS
jgi:hypothetical protein